MTKRQTKLISQIVELASKKDAKNNEKNVEIDSMHPVNDFAIEDEDEEYKALNESLVCF